MEKLAKNKRLVIALVVVALILCGLVIAWQSALYTLNHMSFKQVTTTQMAAAMRKDEFWYDNRFNTLVFDGQVKTVSVSGNITTLGFVTHDPYGASCELINPNIKFTTGQTYKFAVETYQAQRLPHGVLLHNCVAM